MVNPKKWAKGLATAGLTNMMFMPHFGHSIQVNTYMKQLLVFFHGGYLWLDQPYPVDIDLIARITGLPNEEKDLMLYLSKHNTKTIKQKDNLQRVGHHRA